MTTGALTLQGVTRRYPGATTAAVDDVTLEVRPGELMALIGASGSGKTTTLRIAAGYERPDAGQVLLRDASGASRDITSVAPQGRGFGMVFQHYALFPHLSVAENVAFGLEARGVAKRTRLERARQALEQVGLGHAGGRAVQALSGGEQQRVALARALVIEPPVLLLDEPLSNLDPKLRESTRDELRAMLHRLGVTALFVTHDQEDAFAIADRVAMLRFGRLLQVGTPEALYRTPASRHVAEFIGRGTLLPATRVGDRARVTIGGMTLESGAQCHGTPPADACIAVLRPESLTLSPAEGGEGWPGRIEFRRFAGGHLAYRVALADAVAVEVATDDGRWREGDAVRVRVGDAPIALVPA
ncbi:MAG TPA: ABC transporter ATP-binding protein [Gemmatimonadaceae bacterium]